MSDALLDLDFAVGGMQMALPTVGPALPVDGSDTFEIEVPAVAGAVVPAVDPDALPDLVGVLQNHFLYDFYYRIWVIPGTMTVHNPAIGVPIPLHIWNAYPQPLTNTLNAITATNATGLVLDATVGDVYRAIEYRQVNITITPLAPIQVAAEFDFDFDLGTGVLFFNAIVADFVQMVPDPPVTETWEWLTNVIPARDNTEQRIALRLTPRRAIKYSFMLESEDERRRQYGRWYKSLSTRIILPYYQYSTRLTQAGLAGDTKLWFDPAMTDLRDDDYAVVLDEDTETGYLVKIDTVDIDGATTASPLTFDAATTMIISPAFVSRLADRSGFAMKYVTGKIDVDAKAVDYREPFSRPGSTAVIQTYDGLPVLHLRPVARGDTPEIFDADYEVVDGRTGVQSLFSAWPHPDWGTTRKWSIRRRQNPAEMDWWRDFLDSVWGMRDPFLMPSWYADLVLAVDPAPGATTLSVVAPDYAGLYFPFETFRRIQLETDAGIVWRAIANAVDQPDGSTLLTLDTPLGPTPEEAAISKISFLNLVRLSSDTVTLTHERLRTQIELTTKTVDQ